MKCNKQNVSIKLVNNDETIVYNLLFKLVEIVIPLIIIFQDNESKYESATIQCKISLFFN